MNMNAVSVVPSSSSPALSAGVRVRSSWDTQQMLPYNPNAPRKLKKNKPTSQPPPTVTLSTSTTRTILTIADLLKRPTPAPGEQHPQFPNCYSILVPTFSFAFLNFSLFFFFFSLFYSIVVSFLFKMLFKTVIACLGALNALNDNWGFQFF